MLAISSTGLFNANPAAVKQQSQYKYNMPALKRMNKDTTSFTAGKIALLEDLPKVSLQELPPEIQQSLPEKIEKLILDSDVDPFILHFVLESKSKEIQDKVFLYTIDKINGKADSVVIASLAEMI